MVNEGSLNSLNNAQDTEQILVLIFLDSLGKIREPNKAILKMVDYVSSYLRSELFLIDMITIFATIYFIQILKRNIIVVETLKLQICSLTQIFLKLIA